MNNIYIWLGLKIWEMDDLQEIIKTSEDYDDN